MINFIIIIGRNYFCNCVAQSNYLIIQTKILTAHLKNNIETKEYSIVFRKTDSLEVDCYVLLFLKGC